MFSCLEQNKNGLLFGFVKIESWRKKEKKRILWFENDIWFENDVGFEKELKMMFKNELKMMFGIRDLKVMFFVEKNLKKIF